MTWISVVTDSGHESSVDVKRNDLVAEVKAQLVRVFPFFRGQMLTLMYRGKEMMDETSVGSYGIRNLNGVRLVVAASPHQPFSPMDYSRLSKSLIDEGLKSNAILGGGHAPGEWSGVWKGGDSYKSYPPVDVNNRYSTVPPSSSRELIFSPKGPVAQNGKVDTVQDPSGRLRGISLMSEGVQCEIPERIKQVRQAREQRKSERVDWAADEEREMNFRRARQKSVSSDFDAATSGGYSTDTGAGPTVSDNHGSSRRFVNLYACVVAGYTYNVLHKAEGKWMGDTFFMDSGFRPLKKPGYVCSARVGFNQARGCWTEQQLITSNDGISTKQNFVYHPQADGKLRATSDETYLRDTLIHVQEVSPTVVVLTASDGNGVPILTETITYSPDFQSRVRAGQRFASKGFGFLASYVSTETKYVDEESGALDVFP